MELIKYLIYYIRPNIEKLTIASVLLYYGIACTITFLLKLCKKDSNTSKYSWILISLSLLLIFLMTIAGREPEEVSLNLNSILGTYNTIGKTYWWNSLFELVLNTVLFVPLGMSLSKEYCCRDTILLAAGISFAIESVQLISQIGAFEISDIIHNTLGASLGYITFHLNIEGRRK